MLKNEIDPSKVGGGFKNIRYLKSGGIVVESQDENKHTKLKALKDKENIKILPPEVSKWFIKKEQVHFYLVKVHVGEHLNLAICFKCNGYGHVAKYWSDKQSCHKCGQEHAPQD